MMLQENNAGRNFRFGIPTLDNITWKAMAEISAKYIL